MYNRSNVIDSFLYDSSDTDNDLIKNWGDNPHHKLPNTTRFAFQNVRGIGSITDPASEIFDTMHEYNIDTFGCAETNVNWSTALRNRTTASMKLRFGGGSLIPASSQSNKEGYHQGGVAMFITGNATDRIVKRGSDPLGRFAWARLTTPGGNGIIFITAYRVCQKKGTLSGPNTAYMQQVRAHIADGDKTPDPREKIFHALTELIQQNQQQGYSPILALDANEDWERLGENTFNHFMINNGLVDIHERLLQQLPRTTYTRGRRRLDFTLTTETIIPAVTHCGILAEHEGVISDHTLQFVDFDESKLFGRIGQSITPYQQREFHMENSVKRQQFIDELKRIHQHQNIPQRITTLQTHLLTNMDHPEELIHKYNQLDYEITCSIKAAAKSVARKNFGYQRSDSLVEAGSSYLMWKSAYSCKCRRTPLNDKVKRLATATQTDILYIQQCTSTQMQREIQIARTHLRHIQKSDTEERARWLEDKAREKAIIDDADTQATLTRMIRNAHMSSLQRKLTLIAKGQRTSLEYIEVPLHDWFISLHMNEIYHYDRGVFECYVAHPNHDMKYYTHHALKAIPTDVMAIEVRTTPDYIEVTKYLLIPIKWDRITDRAQLEHNILQRNKRHLQQVDRENGIPMHTAFDDLFSNHGTSPAADALLNGEISAELNAFPPPVRNVLRFIAKTEQEAMLPEITGEITTAEFKSAFKAVSEKTSSSPSGLHYTLWKAIATDNELSEYFAIMLSLPFMYGFSPKRWEQCVEVMLEKKAGTRHIHQLRIIGLLEADFNTALKIFFAKKLMWNAESTPLLEEQWGSRPNRTANDAALRKRLTFDMALISYHTLALFMMDATACFDRMVPAISSLIAQKFGMTTAILRSRNTTIANMNRAIRTNHGVSRTAYKQLDNEPRINGEVQGKGDVASLWSLETQVLLQAHRYMCDGIEMTSADGNKTSQRNNDMYVDDTDNWAGTTVHSQTAARHTIQQLQRAAQAWAEILAATGGAVAFPKCKWSALTWNYTSSPPDLLLTPPSQIKLTDAKGATTIIEKTTASTPNIGLGHRMAPNGCQISEFNHRLGQCKDLSRRIAPATLTLEEAHLMIYTRILPKVTYSMPITMFTTSQCKRLNTPIDQVMLPKLHINRHMPKAVIYSTLKHGGINFPKMEVIQLKKGIMFLLRQLRWDHTIANDILIVLSSLQLMSGYTTPLMEDPTTRLDYVTAGWLGHIRSNLAKINATMWIENQWNPPLQRDNDQSIMLAFTNLPGITRKRLERANYWRVYLKIITVCDIADVTGHYIPAGRLYGGWQAKSTLNWPQISRPQKKCMHDFNWCFRKAFLHHGNVRNNRQQQKLRTPLGTWHNTAQHISHDIYMTPDHAYKKCPTGYQRYQRIDQTDIFDIDTIVPSIPDTAHPITAGSDETHLWTNQIFDKKTVLDTPTLTPEHTTIEPTNHPIIVSDGTVHPNSGSGASYTILQVDNNQYEMGDTLDANPHMSSYRTELMGILRGHIIAHKHNIEHAKQYTDSESSVVKLETNLSPNITIEPEADLLLAIHHIRRKMSHPPQISHVKAHQDDDIEFENLPIEAQLNVICDTNANKVRTGEIPSHKATTPYPGAKAMLIIDGQWITTKYEEQITEACTSKQHCEYACKKFNWTTHQYHTVLWDTIGRTRKRYKMTENIRIMKLMYEWTPLGRKNYDFHHEPNCPCCGFEIETIAHMYQCPNARMLKARQTALETMSKYLTHRKLPYIIRTCALDLVREYCGFITTPPTYESTDAIAIWNAQKTFAPDLFLWGFLVTEWRTAMEKLAPADSPEHLVSITHSLWQTLFLSLWETRNHIKHKSQSFITMKQHESCDRDLRLFKTKGPEWIGPHNLFLIDYDLDILPTWSLSNKQEMLRILLTAKGAYKKEMENPTQRLITHYFS